MSHCLVIEDVGGMADKTECDSRGPYTDQGFLAYTTTLKGRLDDSLRYQDRSYTHFVIDMLPWELNSFSRLL